MAARAGVGILRVHLGPLAELRADSALGYDVLDVRRRVLHSGVAVPAALPRCARVEWLLAATDVLLLDVALPRLSGARLRAALPGLAEPMLLGQIEQAFVAAGRPDSAGRATLAVVDRALLSRALEFFAKLEIFPASATPEPLALGHAAGRWRMRLAPGYAFVRTGTRLGFGCSLPEGAQPPAELRLAVQQAGAARPEAIEVEGECDAAAWSAALGVRVALVAARETYASPIVLDVLQEEFAPRMADWRAWRLPGALAAATLLVTLVGLNVDAGLMLREERALRERMGSIFREAFPQTSVVLDPLLQMRRALSDLRSGAGTGEPGDFLPMTAKFALGTRADADAVRALEYRDGVLRVRFDPKAVDSAQKRDALIGRLGEAGLNGRFSESTLTVRKGGAP